MLEIIMVLFTVYTLVKVYIAVMQIGYISEEKSKEAVLMSQEKYGVAGQYAIQKQRIDILSTLVDYGMFVWWVTVGFAWLTSALGTTDTALDAVLFLFGFIAIGFVVGLPFELYQTFELDKEYGFTKTTPKLYLLDQLKGAGMFLVFGGVIFYLMALLITSVESWWLWGFALLFTIAVLVNVIYPTIIAPIFNKFTPLEEGELKTDIVTMMEGVGLKSDGVFVLDASKRDSRLNAYFGGLGKSKRVYCLIRLWRSSPTKSCWLYLGMSWDTFHMGIFGKILG